MFLPRNVDLKQVEELSWLSSPPLEIEVYAFVSQKFHRIYDSILLRYSNKPVFSVVMAIMNLQIEKNYVDGSFKGTTVYFGSFEFKMSGR